ncbi:MAG: AraC family transcriptional regulator [Ruminococcaceae bacterium]|nr:AraC family transcriptional regulator [Oscillospiraceae bacterium]
MSGKYIYYNSHFFQNAPEEPNVYRYSPLQSSIDCPPRPDSPYYCTYLAYRNYANTKYLTFDLGIDKAPPGYAIVDRKMNIFIFNFVIEGKGTFNGKPFERGSFYYSKPHQYHTMRADATEPWVSIWFAVDGSLGKKIADRLDEKYNGQMCTFAHPDELFHLAEFLLYEFPHIQSSTEYIEGVIHLLMTYLFPDVSFDFHEDRNFTLHQQRIIRQSMISIGKELSTVTVASLAEEAHLEVKYYSKIFALVTGISPKEYLLRVKMDMAAHYLVDTAIPVEEITALLGYKHRNSLNAAFTKAYGMTPTDYRKLHSVRE